MEESALTQLKLSLKKLQQDKEVLDDERRKDEQQLLKMKDELTILQREYDKKYEEVNAKKELLSNYEKMIEESSRAYQKLVENSNKLLRALENETNLLREKAKMK